MAIPLLAVAGGAALAKFLGGFFGGKSKANAEKERARETDAAERRAWDIKEQQRVARLKSLISASGARGINIGSVDPSMLVPRPYPGPDSTKGIKGPSLLSSGLDFLGDAGMGYAQYGMGGGGGLTMPSDEQMHGIINDPIVDDLLNQTAPKSMLTPPAPTPDAGFGNYDWNPF